MKMVTLSQERYETMIKKELAFEILREYHLKGYYMDEKILNTLFGEPKNEE